MSKIYKYAKDEVKEIKENGNDGTKKRFNNAGWALI